MARAHYVKTSRKVRRCHAGHDIEIGQPYYWAAPGFRTSRYGKKFACVNHRFRPSQLTNGLASEPMAAVEAFEDAVNGIEHDDREAIAQLEAAWEELTSAVEDYQQQRQDALDQWENGNSQLEEFVYTADAAVDEVSGHQIEEWDGDTDLLDLDPESFEPEPDEDDEEAHAAWEERRDEIEQAHADYESHVEQQIEDALSVALGLEF